jgi:NADH:ubiquinone oxidoreductase subunit F (NADH-binding)
MKTVDWKTPFVSAHPNIEPRLIVPGAAAGRLDLAAEVALNTYGRIQSDVISQLRDAHLRGRGGAGFPAYVKWDFVAKANGEKVVVANGEEGEPSSMKDRWLMIHRPHLILDGLLLASHALKAKRVVIYLSNKTAQESMAMAIEELQASGLFAVLPDMLIHYVDPTYVAGEETAACQSISGGPALPKSKPPRPSESGVDGLPTLVSNVETLAHAAWIHRHGAEAYRRYGTSESPGTTLITLGGVCNRPGVYEVPFGLRLEDAFTQLGKGFSMPVEGIAIGGWFGGLLGPDALELTCSFESCKAAGSGWGCGAMTALGASDKPLAFAARVAAWYQRESAQQCGVCIKGTAAIANAVQALHDGRGSDVDIQNLTRWSSAFPGRGACAFLDGAALLGGTLARNFYPELRARVIPINATEALTDKAPSAA